VPFLVCTQWFEVTALSVVYKCPISVKSSLTAVTLHYAIMYRVGFYLVENLTVRTLHIHVS
jgi:hypothetical protein